MIKILAFSGRKQAGKDTSCDLVEKIYYRELYSTGFVGKFIVNIEGKSTPILHKYNFAYWLKFIAHKILGLSYEQVYGTDEEKNGVTHLRWENMPTVFTTEQYWDIDAWGYDDIKKRLELREHQEDDPEFMTAREVLQYLGTDIFRKMHPNIWVDATIRQIQEDQPIIATISDCRFLSEVETIKKIGGKVIRLTRNSDSNDSHQSEIELDSYQEWDYVIDNKESSLEELEKEVEKMMKELGVI